MRVDRRVRETIALDRASKRSGIRRKTGSDTVFRSRVPFGKEGKTGDGIMAIAVAGARQLMKANVSGGGGLWEPARSQVRTVPPDISRAVAGGEVKKLS